jgi:hypothetical protein
MPRPKFIVKGTAKYDGITVRLELVEAKGRGKDRIWVHAFQTAQKKKWNTCHTQTSRNVGIVGFEKLKKGKL